MAAVTSKKDEKSKSLKVFSRAVCDDSAFTRSQAQH